MKVKIGPYLNWYGPYQIADMLKYIGLSKDQCHNLGEWLSKTWVLYLCEWMEFKRDRHISIVIDDYDVWNMDNTLALIILPMLKKIREDKQGSLFVDNEDVPQELRGPEKQTHEVDDNWHLRWDYVLTEMIFAFESQFNDWEQQFTSGEPDIDFVPIENSKNLKLERGPKDTWKWDREGHMAYQARIDKGFLLFGKYFQALWT